MKVVTNVLIGLGGALLTCAVLSDVHVKPDLALSGLDQESAVYFVPYARRRPVIDGLSGDSSWQQAKWMPMQYLLSGEPVGSEADFSGRVKLLWNRRRLYVLAEIKDDVLVDMHANPLEQYWNDDCLEILIDENASGGDHTKNFNAFAYHIALDNQVVDIGSDGKPLLLNQHIKSHWRRSSEGITWEASIGVFPDSFKVSKGNSPMTLGTGKKMGFMVAYCDADGSGKREHFYATHDVTPVDGDKNLGWKDASVFGRIELIRP